MLLKRPVICLGMFAILFLFMGQFALFTYLRPFLEKVTLVNANQLSILLLILGIAGLLGTFIISHILHKHLYRYSILIPFTMAFLAGALILFGHHVWIIAVLMALWGLIGTSAPVAWNTWLTRSLPHEAETGGGLMVAIIQFAITLGATFGGLLFDWHGYQATFILSAVVLVMSALFASFTRLYLLNVKYQ